MNLLIKIDDWNFEERLSKEFESVGFFISDHPLNQFKEIFEDYNVINFDWGIFFLWICYFYKECFCFYGIDLSIKLIMFE